MRELRVWEESVEGMAVVDIRWQVAIISAIHHQILERIRTLRDIRKLLVVWAIVVRSVFDRKNDWFFDI